jgi:tRNA1(Val) A37 N6-methylase TrmN6
MQPASSSTSPDVLPADDTIDQVLRGRVTLRQARKGYRSSVDALALAWFASQQLPLSPANIADLGTGTGLVAITLGLHWPAANLLAVELQPLLAERSQWSLAANGLQARATVLEHDVRTPLPRLPEVQLTTCNPPYRIDDRHLPPASPERRLAHALLPGVLAGFARASADLLGQQGVSCWVFPWQERQLLLDVLAQAGLGQQRVVPLLHWSDDVLPVRVLVAAQHGPRAETTAAPLWLHDRGHKEEVYCLALEAFLQGLGPDRRAASNRGT